MPFRHHNNVDALLWLDTSAEQHALYLQSFALARLRVEQAVREHAKDARLCVFSDLDETLLDNSAYNAWLAIEGRNFSEDGSWAAYCQQGISAATPGAAGFLDGLRELGVAIVFVTSRKREVREGTVSSLRRLFPAAPGDLSDDVATTHLLMKGNVVRFTRADGTVVEGDRKYVQYEYIAATRGLTPVLWLGDNLSDFDPGYGSSVPHQDRLARARDEHAERFGTRWIAFPNPVYGGFLQSLRDGEGHQVGDDEHAGVMSDEALRFKLGPDVSPKSALLERWAIDPIQKVRIVP